MEGTPWKAIASAVMALPQHGKLHVRRDEVPHPRDAGLYRSVGWRASAATTATSCPMAAGCTCTSTTTTTACTGTPSTPP